MVGKYRHFYGLFKGLVYFVFRSPCLFHQPVSFRLSDRAVQYSSHLCLCQFSRERSIRLVAILLVKCRLQKFHYMFIHSLLGILLHPGIYGGIYLQSVRIDIVWFSLFVPVLVAPSIQRVIFPVDGICNIFCHVPRGIPAALWLLGRYVLSEIFSEIGGYSLLMIRHMEFQSEWLATIFFVFLLCDVF